MKLSRKLHLAPSFRDQLTNSELDEDDDIIQAIFLFAKRAHGSALEEHATRQGTAPDGVLYSYRVTARGHDVAVYFRIHDQGGHVTMEWIAVDEPPF